MSDKLYWRLTANGDASISKGKGCFHWLRNEYPDYAPIYVVKKEDYQKLQSQLSECQEQLQEAREEAKEIESAWDESQCISSDSINMLDEKCRDMEKENQQLKEQLSAKDEALEELYQTVGIHPENKMRHRATIVNIHNAIRRSECLSEIERFHIEKTKDEFGEEIENSLLNWGESPDEYSKRYKKIIDEQKSALQEKCERLENALAEIREEWEGSQGFVAETAQEAYLRRVCIKMQNIAIQALQQEDDR